MNSEVKNIVFDFNGVISKANKKEILNKLNFKDVCNLVRFGFSYLTNHGFRQGVKQSYKGIMSGEMSSEEVYCFFNSSFSNMGDSVKNTIESFVSSMKTQDGLIRLIDYLRENGFKVFILSNSIPNTEPLINSTEIKSHFDGVYCSSERGFIKPNKNIFEDACNLWGIDPKESIFVDDKKENVKGAISAGFNNAFHLSNESDIINQISDYVL